MFFEPQLLTLLLLWGGLVLLVFGYLSWARHASSLYSFLGASGLLPLVVWYATSLNERGLVWATGGYQALVTGQAPVWADWQFSVFLACLVPALSFGALVLTRPLGIAVSGLMGLGVLLGVGAFFIVATSLLCWLIAFELLLLSSLYLLRLTSKSERIGEAVAEMFFWTLAGSVCLLFAFVVIAASGKLGIEDLGDEGAMPAFVGLLLLVGFGVKLPIWPCYSWLLKAHVEASVEFSILLSGVVVKFGALGLYRVLALQSGNACAQVLLACSTLAVIEAGCRLMSQRDLKRIVALTTVIELNWVGVCLGLGGGLFEQVGAFVLVAHSLTTTGEFFGVECLYRRYGSRDLTEVAGVAQEAPLLFACLFLTTLTTIGFPATSLFAAKLWFLTAVAQVSFALCAVWGLFFLLILPVLFIRVWVPVWFGQRNGATTLPDVTGRELALLAVTLLGSLVLGLWPASVVSVL